MSDARPPQDGPADESAPPVELGAIDSDGALGDAAERVWGDTRAGMLRRTVLGGASAIGLLASLSAPARAQAPARTDTAILNFALLLEYLQADFYTEAERLDTLSGATARQARVVGGHERAHVQALQDALGREARPRPTFNFRGVTEDPAAFRRTAVAFEDLSVAAYAGQAPRIESPAYRAAALGILAVEARHAAWIRRIAGRRPAADAFDEPRSRAEVLRLVRGTNFIAAEALTSSTERPRYTG